MFAAIQTVLASFHSPWTIRKYGSDHFPFGSNQRGLHLSMENDRKTGRMNQVWTRLTFDQRGDVAIEHWRVPTFLYDARFTSGIFSNLSAFQGFSRSQ